MPATRARRSRDFDLLRPFWSEPVHRRVLPNGLTVLLKPDHSSALCSVQVWVKTGSIHEGALLGGGLSHFLEHMLFKGTERRAGREISATVQAHGGYINAYTTFDRTVYYIDIPSEHTAVAVDLLADAVLHSTLPADEVERERQVILREIDMTLDEPDQRLGQTLFETAFRQHPYQHPIIGHRAVFEGVSRDDLVAYYRARYVPNNLVLVVAGHFEPAALLPVVEQHFGSAPRARLAPVYLPDEAVPLASREAHLFEDVQISRAGLGWQIPGLAHADTPVLDLLGTVLGYGNSCILWEELREKRRLVHSIEASAWNPGSVGLFYVSMLCDPDKRQAAAAAVQAELAKIARRGVPPALLKKAVRQLVVGEINTRKTMSGQASRLGLAEVVVGDLHYSRHYFDRLATVTPADIRRVAAKYFVPERFTAVSMNPKGAAAGAVAAVPAAELGDFTEERLGNGARLLLLPDKRLPNLHLRLVCLGGVAHDLPAARGALSLMVTLLTKDTKRRTSDEVAELVESVGGTFNEFSGNNTFGLSLEVLPGDVDRALDVLGEAVLAPAFAPATLEIEREAQLASLAEQADDVVTVARKLIRRRFFGAHPLAIDPHGTEEGTKAVTPALLRALHRQLLVAGNCVLAATGDFEPRALAPKLKAFLRRLPKGAAPAAGPDFAGPQAGVHEEIQPRQQAVVFQAYPCPGIRGADHFVSEVADEVFSGMASNLFERVREQKGLAYFVRSSRVLAVDTGLFGFYAGTAPDKAREVLDEIEAEIRRVQEGGIAPEELLRCQTRLKAARRMSLQTNGARALQAALNASYGLPVNDWKNYDARIDAVTIEQLRDFARRYFTPAQRVELVVRP
ncbi:MAG TPA: pitrilysin family protein [Opitutaceae bacterium]|nr:pitrilysin family protein [Opitutaceae bacterium]